jgi:hypothetical protein
MCVNVASLASLLCLREEEEDVVLGGLVGGCCVGTFWIV